MEPGVKPDLFPFLDQIADPPVEPSPEFFAYSSVLYTGRAAIRKQSDPAEIQRFFDPHDL